MVLLMGLYLCLLVRTDCQQNWYVNREFYFIGRTYCIFWNIFTTLTFLYNIEFYLQHVLQFNHNVYSIRVYIYTYTYMYIYVYTLVILPIFKIS